MVSQFVKGGKPLDGSYTDFLAKTRGIIIIDTVVRKQCSLPTAARIKSPCSDKTSAIWCVTGLIALAT